MIDNINNNIQLLDNSIERVITQTALIDMYKEKT